MGMSEHMKLSLDLEAYFFRTRHLWQEFISLRFPLDLEMLKKNEDYLDWHLVSMNKTIRWSPEIIESFKAHWDWMQLTRNKAVYRGIPDIEPLIEKYADFWSWKHLKKRKKNILTDKLLRLYQARVIRYPETPPNKSYYDLLSLRFPNTPEDWLSVPSEHWRYMPWLFRCFPYWNSSEYIEFLDFLQEHSSKINWSVISSFSWIESDMIAQFEEHWDWKVLSRNKNLKYSLQLLHQYRHRWEWPIHKVHDQSASTWPVELSGSGLRPQNFPGFFKLETENWHRIRKPLNIEVLSAAVEDDMSWIRVNLLQSTKIAWSIDLYKEFEEKWLLPLMTVPRHVFKVKWSPELVGYLLKLYAE